MLQRELIYARQHAEKWGHSARVRNLSILIKDFDAKYGSVVVSHEALKNKKD